MSLFGPSATSLIAVMFAVFGSMAIAAQDRYTLKLGKLSFSDFRGYENWKDVAVSQTETQLKVIVANDVMIGAYRQGLPADGKFFPEPMYGPAVRCKRTLPIWR